MSEEKVEYMPELVAREIETRSLTLLRMVYWFTDLKCEWERRDRDDSDAQCQRTITKWRLQIIGARDESKRWRSSQDECVTGMLLLWIEEHTACGPRGAEGVEGTPEPIAPGAAGAVGSETKGGPA
jgi:hypothetical protein